MFDNWWKNAEEILPLDEESHAPWSWGDNQKQVSDSETQGAQTKRRTAKPNSVSL